ncbi:MAG: DUF2007 domain-containing protein [Methylobacillus sp.]|jgi:hypothetical protein|nr:DUF2007 domain-containing protein [Methylobacillus sp.]
MSDSSFITIASFSFPHEAHIAQASLEAEGIPAFIADEHTINMQWLFSNALGGVRVRVPREFAEKAREILAQDYSQLLDEEFGKDDIHCQKCGSANVEPYTEGKKPAFLVFLLLGFPLFFYRHGVKCKDCGAFSKT